MEAENLGLLVYSPLRRLPYGQVPGKQGRRPARLPCSFRRWTSKKVPGVLAAMDKIAAAHGASLAAVALAWLRHQPAVTSIILGIKQPANSTIT